MPILKGSASDFTSTVKGSAEVNAAVGGAVARGGNANPPRAAGAIAAVVTQSAIARSSGLQPTRFRVVASTGPVAAPAAPTFNSLTLTNAGSNDTFVVKYDSNGGLLWATRIGGVSSDRGLGIAMDSSGNIYTTGFYDSNLITIYNSDSSVFETLSKTGGSDGFLIKYNSSGVVQWKTAFGGTAGVGGGGGNWITIDNTGNIIIGGYYSNGFRLFSADNSLTLSLTNNEGDAFVAKYNSSGIIQWAARISGAGTETVNSLCTDTNGDIYVFGRSKDANVNIYQSNNTTIFKTISPTTNFDVFIVKYNSSGVPQWATIFNGNDLDESKSITIDISGNIYAMVYSTSTSLLLKNADNSTFGTITNDGAKSTNTYIIKLNSSGIIQYILKIEGPSVDEGFELITDSVGNLYACGYFASLTSIISQNGSSVSVSDPNGGGRGCGILVKFNSSGIYQWLVRLQPDGGPAVIVQSVKTDATGNVYVGGHYEEGPMRVFNKTGPSFASLTNQGSHDGFIVKYNSDGLAQWTSRIVGSGVEQVNRMSIDSTGNLVAVGRYSTNPVSIYSQGL